MIKMKNKFKIVIPLLVVIILTGCNLNNNPTSKVEEALSKYQMLDKDISIDNSIEMLTNGDDLTETEKEKYKKIIKKQYQNLSYEIKNEKVDGNTAIIETQIKVIDYKKAIENLDNEIDKTNYTTEQYNEQKIEKLNKAKDKVTYTIEFSVTKDSDGNWNLDKITSTEEQKLLGLY
jgi:DNA primase catalytic subunit